MQNLSCLALFGLLSDCNISRTNVRLGMVASLGNEGFDAPSKPFRQLKGSWLTLPNIIVVRDLSHAINGQGGLTLPLIFP